MKLLVEGSSVRKVILFSGGLDSLLAAKVIEADTFFAFYTPFFGMEKIFSYWAKNRDKFENKPVLVIDDYTDELLGLIFEDEAMVLRNPTEIGKALNPCKLCHLNMIRIAHKSFKNSVIATGEVLDERPLSQNKRALLDIADKVEVLRPLSARFLPETSWERSGVINRKRLLAIRGRSRKVQTKLAKEWGLDYPAPSGGCLLTEEGFADKLIIFWKVLNNQAARRIEKVRRLQHVLYAAKFARFAALANSFVLYQLKGKVFEKVARVLVDDKLFHLIETARSIGLFVGDIAEFDKARRVVDKLRIGNCVFSKIRGLNIDKLHKVFKVID